MGVLPCGGGDEAGGRLGGSSQVPRGVKSTLVGEAEIGISRQPLNLEVKPDARLRRVRLP